MSEGLKQQIALLFFNMVKLICFAGLAVFFNKWELVLLTIVFWTSRKD